MVRTPYVPKRFTPGRLNTIKRANVILNKYAKQGFTLTLRQLYYKFVVAGYIKNDLKSYRRLGSIISDARLAGLIDWEHIEDRTRWLSEREHYDSEDELLTEGVKRFHIDMWANQPYRPEVWIEKDALSGMIAGVCGDHDVPYFCCRGYASLSEMWRASMRLRRHSQNGQVPYIIHFGDHDPSGIDMSRDIEERLHRTFLSDFEFKRVALMLDQIAEFKPPPNPAKVTDSRYQAYVKKYGHESWELDALEPSMFRDLIESELTSVRDPAMWAESVKRKAKAVKRLKTVVAEWRNHEIRMKELADKRHRLQVTQEELSDVRQKLAECERKLRVKEQHDKKRRKDH